MFRQMRRKNQLLPKDRTIEILEKASSGTLALLGDNDYPYAVPISYVYSGGKIYFHSANSGHKIDAIKKCNKASFCVIEQDKVVAKEYTTYFRSVIAFGKIRIIEDEEEKYNAIKILAEKYSGEYKEGIETEIKRFFNALTMIELDIEHITGKEAKELVKK